MQIRAKEIVVGWGGSAFLGVGRLMGTSFCRTIIIELSNDE